MKISPHQHPVFPAYALIAAAFIFLIHFALLAESLSDYRVTIDSAYHVSMARQWGEHWWVPWDYINFGPGGRPNLQGPLFQAVIGALGRILGGRGSDYVLANAIAALAQWSAAAATAAFFAFRLEGERAALFAVSVFSGAAFASSSFAVGIPSGWLFILTGWALWFFTSGREFRASIAAALAIYMHIAGFATVPVAILIAAALTGKWRDMLIVGALTAIATSPYLIQLLRNLQWMSSAQSHPAVLFDPLLGLLAAAGTLVVLKRPRDNAFLAAWLLGPALWLLHDPARLILQSAVAGSVAAGVMLARAMDGISSRRTVFVLGYTLAVGVTVFPLGIPSLAPEITWDLGLRYPRGIDWNNSRQLAHEIRRAGLSNRLIADYQPSLCPALAVFVPVSCEKGHWVEVKPRHDAADDIPAADKAYIVPLPMDDPLLVVMQKRGWIAIHGGMSASTLITLVADSPPAPEVASFVMPIIVRDSQWLGKNAVNNTIRFGNWRSVVSFRALQQRRTELQTQRVRAGHIELSCLVYASSLGTDAPADSRTMRRLARGFGVIASFLSDGFTIDYVSETRFASFKNKLNDFARRNARCVLPNQAFKVELMDALANALYMGDDTFAERPTGDVFPWVAQR